ncbi:MAG: hypothetical protein V3R83_01015 [Gammaproteobacteria bacterium]
MPLELAGHYLGGVGAVNSENALVDFLSCLTGDSLTGEQLERSSAAIPRQRAEDEFLSAHAGIYNIKVKRGIRLQVGAQIFRSIGTHNLRLGRPGSRKQKNTGEAAERQLTSHEFMVFHRKAPHFEQA